MQFINYCEEPLFFMKIYNSISDEKRDEFEKKLEDFRNVFNEYHDHKLFNPTISFKDSFIIIKQDNELVTRIDLREELNRKVLINEDLLEDILYEFNISHGLHVCDRPEKITDYKYQIDFTEICDKIEQILN